jgi:uncharacterized membrane protein YozB (DUF420 family)
MDNLENILPHVNAALNLVAATLLVIGFTFIKRAQRTCDKDRRGSLEFAHMFTMLSCFGVSTIFLASYLYYHLVVMEGLSKKFPTDAGPVRYVYYAILLSHVVLAAAVPFMAIGTIYFGLRDIRSAHRKLARWTFPIWLYVSITGVVVYVMLYQLYAR